MASFLSLGSGGRIPWKSLTSAIARAWMKILSISDKLVFVMSAWRRFWPRMVRVFSGIGTPGSSMAQTTRWLMMDRSSSSDSVSSLSRAAWNEVMVGSDSMSKPRVSPKLWRNSKTIRMLANASPESLSFSILARSGKGLESGSAMSSTGFFISVRISSSNLFVSFLLSFSFSFSILIFSIFFLLSSFLFFISRCFISIICCLLLSRS